MMQVEAQRSDGGDQAAERTQAAEQPQRQEGQPPPFRHRQAPPHGQRHHHDAKQYTGDILERKVIRQKLDIGIDGPDQEAVELAPEDVASIQNIQAAEDDVEQPRHRIGVPPDEQHLRGGPPPQGIDMAEQRRDEDRTDHSQQHPGKESGGQIPRIGEAGANPLRQQVAKGAHATRPRW